LVTGLLAGLPALLFADFPAGLAALLPDADPPDFFVLFAFLAK
jgi:hypothetical protein